MSPSLPPVITQESIGGALGQPIFNRNQDVVHQNITVGQGFAPLTGQTKIPSWNNAGRPKRVKPGLLGFNIETHNLEYWTGSLWLKLPMKKI